MYVAPGVLIYVVNLIYFIDLDLITIVMWFDMEIEIDMYFWNIFYCSLLKVYYWVHIPVSKLSCEE